MPSREESTIQSLRSDLALQIARLAKDLGTTQARTAVRLGLPQPTVSKIINGRVSDLSVELLIRVAVRAGLLLALQTGRVPAEAGVFVSGRNGRVRTAARSTIAEGAREALARSERRLTATERLEAFLEHNQLLCELSDAPRLARHPRIST